MIRTSIPHGRTCTYVAPRCECQVCLPAVTVHVPDTSNTSTLPVCLLQLGTSDGRVKVVGQEGVEMSIVSPSPTGTKHLQFLTGRGAVLRVNLVRFSMQA